MRFWGTLVVMPLAGCIGIGAAPPDISDDVDDPEYEDESEVEGLVADDSAPENPVPIHVIGEQLEVCASSLNQRSGPGTSHAILRQIPEDEVVTILAESG